MHIEENIEPEANFRRLVNVLNVLSEEHQLPIIFSTPSSYKKRIDGLGLEFHKLVNLLEPLGFLDYVKLQTSSKVVLSDSGTITEEVFYSEFPCT